MKNLNSIEEVINEIAGMEPSSDKAKQKRKKLIIKQLDRAYEIRAFELELYWKRAAYFWTFIGVSLAGYFALDENDLLDEKYSITVLCIGFVFSLSWYLVNRGSGYWVSHWERIIDAIEEYLGRELYKVNLTNLHTILEYKSHYPFSVSKVNILVSLFVCVMWLLMLIEKLSPYFKKFICINIEGSNLFIWVILIATATFSWHLTLRTTGSRESTYAFYKRDVKF